MGGLSGAHEAAGEASDKAARLQGEAHLTLDMIDDPKGAGHGD